MQKKYLTIDEQIEITFKSYISNLISEKYGVLFEDYLRKENFIADTGANGEYSFEDMKNFIKKEILKNIKSPFFKNKNGSV